MTLLESEIILYHSTDRQSFESIQDHGALIGHYLPHPMEGYSGGANLTSDKQGSLDYIRSFRGSGQWTNAEGPPDLVILTFRLPRSLTINTGVTRYVGCPEFATILPVEAEFIPEVYFHSIEAKHFPMPKTEAIEKERRGEMRFYMMPVEYLVNTEPVSYTFRGVQYPLK